jgi:hypothetical protein
MAAAAIVSLTTNQTRESIRAEHRVRLLTQQEEGRGFSRIPEGVYGFTNAPATETPVFLKQTFQSFEVHKLAGGHGRLLGYCTQDQARAIAGEPDLLEMDLYPEPYETATVLVALPIEWITNGVYKVVRRPGGPVTLRVSAL